MRVSLLGLVPLLFFGLISCTLDRPSGIHEVIPFQLTSTQIPDQATPMVRNEVLRRLHGAVFPSERRNRLGHYFTVRWSITDPSAGPVELVLRYQQAKTASKEWVKSLAMGEVSGKEQLVELKVAGPEFAERGPVLAWRIELLQGGEIVDVEESFLWR